MTTIHDMCAEINAPDRHEVRGKVIAFARLMETALLANDYKGGWDECDPRWLLAKLTEEVGELAKVVVRMYRPNGERFHQSDPRVGNMLILMGVREAADVGNVAMMLTDVLSREYQLGIGVEVS